MKGGDGKMQRQDEAKDVRTRLYKASLKRMHIYGVGIMRHEKLNLMDLNASHTLGCAGDSPGTPKVETMLRGERLPVPSLPVT